MGAFARRALQLALHARGVVVGEQPRKLGEPGRGAAPQLLGEGALRIRPQDLFQRLEDR